jgi:hypothetical protein
MQPPPRYFVPDGMVCHLRRSLYGLKRAAHAWFERLYYVVTAAGFSPALMISRYLFTIPLMGGLFSSSMLMT